VFTVSGCVQWPGAFEVPLGITLRQIIDQFAGGMRNGSTFKAALTGGAAGTIVPAALADVPIDFTSGQHGVALGSGAMIILDETVSIPMLLASVLHFFEVESCGKCTPCREGTRELRLLCGRIAEQRAQPADAVELARLARLIQLTSFCGLGQSVAGPVESALRHFGAEFLPPAALSQSQVK
jgi:NADH:ubiquinone oxidoreductase subunit F (NADH-binding)